MGFQILSLIDKKRLGLNHTSEELTFLVEAVMAQSIPDYQLAAWLMAVCCKGLTLDETTELTRLYVESGRKLDFSNLDGIVADKHSTGGVGDKTTLILMPLLAACGVKIAKLSGRGLGFTGGTVDKLEAIPQMEVGLSAERFLKQVQELGIALGSQTDDLAPADGIIYALRDVSGTVESIPLIAASVVSKKIAAGAQVITLDIKAGEGAFMKNVEDARQLAETCREVGARLGRSISTLISSMDQPLGCAIGHSVEVQESIDTLRGHGPEDLTQLCIALGSLTLMDAGLADSIEAAEHTLQTVIDSGQALEKFRAVIAAQNGNADVIDQPELLPQPAHKLSVLAETSGYVHACHPVTVAQAAKVLGAGRMVKSAPIDLAVGVILKKKIGDPVEHGDVLAELWANEIGIDEAVQYCKAAFEIGPNPVPAPQLILDICHAGVKAC